MECLYFFHAFTRISKYWRWRYGSSFANRNYCLAFYLDSRYCVTIFKILLIRHVNLYVYSIHFSYSFDQDPTIRPLVEQDSNSLQQMVPEIPLWVKNPDYDRVCILMLVLVSISD